MRMLTAVSFILAVEAQAAQPTAGPQYEALQLRLGMVRIFCNASNVGLWPQAANALPCQLMQKRKDLMSGSSSTDAAKAETSRAMKDALAKADKSKLHADKKLVYESVCAQGSKYARWKLCHNMDVRKFMLGPAAAAAPVISAGAKGKGGGSTGAVKAKGKGKGSGLPGGTG